ncbi:MAG: hypothetical protein EOP45_03610 [Sphingobacteriaceae bacterium]|nr:MAG: hypothetical protein EOP45_03610 [Sphingobacteriaceae bacterium]
MKIFKSSYFSCFLIFLISINAQCKKELNKVPLNVTLYNKPLSVIQSNIQGNWKLQYIKGGFIANYIKYFQDENILWQFPSGTRVLQNYNGNIYTDTTISWVRDLGVNTGRDSTFILKFYDKRGYPYNYVVDGIFNDSLVIHDNANDGQHYHFSKRN